MLTKTCSKCKKEKPATVDYFHRHKNGKFNLCGRCKECRKQDSINNKEKISQYNKKYHAKNKESISERKKKYWEKTKDRQLEYNKRWRDNNKKSRNEWEREYSKKRRNENELIRIHGNIANAINAMIKEGRKTGKTSHYLGCSIEELVAHLNKTKPDTDQPLHIDHIIPKSLYDLTEEDLTKCWNYRNLRWITAEENLKKGDALNMDLVRTYKIQDLLP